MSNDDVWLNAIEAQFLQAAAIGAEVVETSAFRVHIRRDRDVFYRSVAVPRHRPAFWLPAIAELRMAFARKHVAPRLEFLANCWPDLTGALAAAGFEAEAEQPVMARGLQPVLPALQCPVHLFAPLTPSSMLETYLKATHAAFGEAPERGAAAVLEVASLQRAIAEGRCHVAVVVDANGSLAAAAALIGITRMDRAMDRDVPARAAELAAVWTLPTARRQGLARAVSAALCHCFFQAGPGTIWLAARGESARRLYRGLGFREVGRQWSSSAAAS